ncbi:uncharacterized protein V2V93DRAFT_126644 [Kockiozyma suomiensis]|uniref:uncharacterized protein n=1 Tax=Kockiozyma suomiensis TaxID=1337062 RepID=UPI00334409A0
MNSTPGNAGDQGYGYWNQRSVPQLENNRLGIPPSRRNGPDSFEGYVDDPIMYYNNGQGSNGFGYGRNEAFRGRGGYANRANRNYDQYRGNFHNNGGMDHNGNNFRQFDYYGGPKDFATAAVVVAAAEDTREEVKYQKNSTGDSASASDQANPAPVAQPASIGSPEKATPSPTDKQNPTSNRPRAADIPIELLNAPSGPRNSRLSARGGPGNRDYYSIASAPFNAPNGAPDAFSSNHFNRDSGNRGTPSQSSNYIINSLHRQIPPAQPSALSRRASIK